VSAGLLTFTECLLKCAENREFVAQFDRLSGTALSNAGRGGINEMIDKATGRQAEDVHLFVAFVWDAVWTRLPRDEASRP